MLAVQRPARRDNKVARDTGDRSGTKETEKKKYVESVQRALRLVRAFNQATPEWGVRDLARHLQMPKTVIFRLLITMEQEGFIEQNPATQRYRLGRAIFEAAAAYASQNDLITVGERSIRELVSRTQHSSQLGVLDGTQHLSLVVVQSSAMVRLNIRPGDRKPAHATATGKVLLAGMSDERVLALFPAEQLDALTENTITNVRDLVAELEKVRNQGYALSYGESTAGIAVAAAPIFDYRGQVVAGVSLAWLDHLVPETEIPYLMEQVVACAKDISRRLGPASEVN